MFLNEIQLNHYRNYEHLTLSTDHRVNLFVGANAQGKTNLLEAIYVLALSKSHRTHKDKELIAWQADQAEISGRVERKLGQLQLRIKLSGQGKKVSINGLEQRKLSQYIGTLNAVMFAPEDLEIVKGSPGIRRRFLDVELGQVYSTYLYHLTQFQKLLSQRNNLLKQWHAPGQSAAQAMIDIWDEQLAEYGSKIIRKRQQFITQLQHWAERIHSSITNSGERLKIVYRPSLECDPDAQESVLINQFMIKLSQMREQEIRRGTTLVGPHRDDIVFFINDKDAQIYGSQGQQRTVGLSVKLAEIELIHQEIGEYPLLLLDDVLSELDQDRQNQLITTFQDKVQTFITTTGVESLKLHHLRDVALYKVENGQVHKQLQD